MEKTLQSHGEFVWQELQSDDLAKVRPFYESLLGWSGKVWPMPGGDYVVFAAGETMAAGAMARDSRHTAEFAGWLPYLLVDDVDAAAKKAAELGGSVAFEPHDIPEVGRSAVLADPSGALFCVIRWTEEQPRDQPGPGLFCWYELVSADPGKAKSFYSDLFGWKTGSMDMGEQGEYTLWKQGKRDLGGMMKLTAEWGDKPSHWMTYVQVEDADDRAAAVESSGGKVCVPPMDIPGVGRFCVVEDPAGAPISLIAFPVPESK